MKDIKGKIERRLEYLKKRREELPGLVQELEGQIVQLRTEYLVVTSQLEELTKLIEVDTTPDKPEPEKATDNKKEDK